MLLSHSSDYQKLSRLVSVLFDTSSDFEMLVWSCQVTFFTYKFGFWISGATFCCNAILSLNCRGSCEYNALFSQKVLELLLFVYKI